MDVTEYLPKDLFKGKTLFVTGGGSGINLGIGKTFAALGANIGICGRKGRTAAWATSSPRADTRAAASSRRSLPLLHQPGCLTCGWRM